MKIQSMDGEPLKWNKLFPFTEELSRQKKEEAEEDYNTPSVVSSDYRIINETHVGKRNKEGTVKLKKFRFQVSSAVRAEMKGDKNKGRTKFKQLDLFILTGTVR